MKILHNLLLAVVFSTTPARADGIPVDRKTHRVTMPHTLLSLSSSQSEEIETLGTLTLSHDQWRQLRRIGSNCPKRIALVVPVTWSDCTCDFDFYAIQTARDQVAITHQQLSHQVPYEFTSLQSNTGDLWLRVDRRGQFYHEGVLIPFGELMRMIEGSSGKGNVRNIPPERMIGIELPVGVRRDSAAVKTRLDKFYKAARERGWNTQERKG